MTPDQKEAARIWADSARESLIIACNFIAEDKADEATAVLRELADTAYDMADSFVAQTHGLPRMARLIEQLKRENARHTEAIRVVGDGIAREVAAAGPVQP